MVKISHLFDLAFYKNKYANSLNKWLVMCSGISRNVNRERPVSDPVIVGEGIAGDGSGRGFPSPQVMGKHRKHFWQLICFYTSFSTCFVVKFISLVVHFKVFLELKYDHSNIFLPVMKRSKIVSLQTHLKHDLIIALIWLKNDSILWHNLWVSSGRLSSGTVHLIKRACKLKYKSAIKSAYVTFVNKHNDELFNHFINKKFI